jgi:hypothetical protein
LKAQRAIYRAPVREQAWHVTTGIHREHTDENEGMYAGTINPKPDSPLTSTEMDTDDRVPSGKALLCSSHTPSDISLRMTNAREGIVL